MFAVIELQKSDTLAVLADTYATRAEADNKFHLILAAAAISSVPIHSAVILSEDGLILANGTYTHEG